MEGTRKGSLQGFHLLQSLYVTSSTVRDELCLQTRTLKKSFHGTNHTEKEPFSSNIVPLSPRLIYATCESQLCICLESWPHVNYIYVPSMYTSLPRPFHHQVSPNTNQPSQMARLASSFSLSVFPTSSLAISLLFRSFSLTARSYALLSSVFFGGFTPSAPAIKRPAAADDFSGLLSEPVGERGVLLEEFEL